MNRGILFLAMGCILFSICYVLLERRRIRKMTQRIEEMIRAAMKGSLHESSFDETQLSRLESTLAHYLAANEMSVKNLAAEKEKVNTLISDISHQTKTPISNLLLYSELLREETLSESAMESTAKIHDQAKKLRFLIDSLVKLSRLETGIIAVNPFAQSVSDLLLAIGEQYKPQAEAKGLELMVQVTEARAVFDKKWTLEAVGNIVDNAIKYTEKGTVTISVCSYELFTCIQIKDTGKGIRESEQAAVFGRFYRSRDVKDEKGVGIGLFLARQIIQSQGGYMKLSSTVGKGSEFSIYLPAVP
ncbi:MAG: HAMP domain-containing histidine kinase [Lachnospiraceae bacterium]|nr:HAMP domain-containing histidine kinase [Lachnospiraceae bacterium]